MYICRMLVSYTEENYLKAIFALGRLYNEQEVSTNQISEHLKNKAASVTDMLKRLAEKKLIDYRPYRGVKLTEKGKKAAVKVIRKHRLWEFFLVEKLKFKWDEVHEIAEQLEHIQSDDLIQKLDNYLGNPKADPHGDPIPDASGKFLTSKSIPLSLAAKKSALIVTGVSDHSTEFLRLLSDSGICLGQQIKIEEHNNYDKSVTVRINNKRTLFLSHKAASNILVKLKP